MGEILPVKTCSILFDKFQACSIANAYGPTEATIVTTHIFVTKEMLQKYNVLPIGYAINDKVLSIKKDHPEAEYGELFISGKHVAAGYYREKELTEKKFFVLNGQTTFKSGDLAKEENGLWFFGGRNDDQIKLHGFRIELDEISAVLQQFSAIEMACTIALKRNNEVKKLISFVTLKNRIKLAVVDFELKEFLNKKLPYYMQPSEVLEINEFPTSVSHKIDKNKLLNNYLSNLQ
jgi:D-alanine--poly(phosphoribitol) ligase subunit 1